MKAQSDMDERLLDEALGWYRALEGDGADWDAFTRWLEAEPRHARAFDEMALAHRIVEDHRESLRAVLPARAEPVRARRRWLAYGGAVAASLAAVMAVPLLRSAPADMVYATAAGETRKIALPDGVAVELSPHTRLIAHGGKGTALELARGEAYFTVAHDPGRTLSIRAGGYAVRDIGTQFAVNMTGEALVVGVAEGMVSVDQDATGAGAQLSAGQQLVARGPGGPILLSSVEARNVGSWRQGRLSYDNTPLSVVAADISRYCGKLVVIDPAMGDRRFSGILVIGDGSRLPADLAGLMGVSYRQEGDRIHIGAAAAR